MSTADNQSNLLQCGLLWSTQKGDKNKVYELVHNGVNCNVQDSDGLTPLHHAACDGNVELVRLLLDAGADYHVTTQNSCYTPLHMAAVFQSATNDVIAEMLIKAGANVNIVDSCGKSPLAYASLSGNLNLVLKLLENNADPNLQDSGGWTALHWACSENHPDIVRLLLRYGANCNICENDSWSALHWAGFKGYPHIVAMLLSADADYNQEDGEGFTPLNTTMLSGNDPEHCLQVIKYLAEAGANINHAGSIGWTALHRAATEKEFNNISSYLLQSRAIPDVQNISGDTPLHIATSSRNVSMVKMLIQFGASMTIQDIEWKTPLQRAIETLDPDVIRPFFGAGAALKVRVIDIENTVIDTIANYSRNKPLNMHNPVDTAESLFLLYEAGILDYSITKRMLGLIHFTVPILSLKSISRTCIHRYIHNHNETTYAKLGLPFILNQYLNYEYN